MIESPGVILSFDDRFVEQWVNARWIFEKHNARATFFISEFDKLSEDEIDKLLILQNDGHCIGSHGLRHRDAVKAIETLGASRYVKEEIMPAIKLMRQAGINDPESCFAYPVSSRTEQTDELLLKFFRNLRTGVFGRDLKNVLMPLKSLKSLHCLKSVGIDDNGGLSCEQIFSLIDKLVPEDSIIVFYAHSIQDYSDANHISPEKLDKVLSYIVSCNLPFYTFADL